MPYTPTTWVEGVTKLGPTNMNHLETGVSGSTTTADAAIAKPSSPASNDGLVWNGSTWVNAKLVNANIDPAAAIAYSKLSLAASIVNADIATAAAIAASKLASYPSDGTKFLAGDGTWKAASGTIYRKTTSKAVNTTVGATDLLNAEITIGAGVMGTTGTLRLTADGDWMNNSASTLASPRLQLVFGGVTLLDTGISGTNVSGVTRNSWGLVAIITNLGAANSQKSHVRLQMMNNGASTQVQNTFTTGEGILVSLSAGGQVIFGEGINPSTAVDTSLAKALVLNVINGSASASYETKLTSALVEIV